MRNNKRALYESIMSKVSREVKRALNENTQSQKNLQEILTELSNDHYKYYNKCNKMEADEVQEITKWDEFCKNEYCIDDDWFNEGIYIIPIDIFLKCTEGEYRPSVKSIDYCAYNDGLGILFCYTKRGIHYFYE